MPIRSARKRPTHRPTRHRPRIVSFVSWLMVLQGLGFLVAGAMRIVVSQWGDLGIAYLTQHTSHPTTYLLLTGSIWISLGLLAFICALALWRLHKFGWVAAMLLQMVALIYALVVYLRGSPNYLAMVFGVVIVFILNNQEVQDVFRR